MSQEPDSSDSIAVLPNSPESAPRKRTHADMMLDEKTSERDDPLREYPNVQPGRKRQRINYAEASPMMTDSIDDQSVSDAHISESSSQRHLIEERDERDTPLASISQIFDHDEEDRDKPRPELTDKSINQMVGAVHDILDRCQKSVEDYNKYLGAATREQKRTTEFKERASEFLSRIECLQNSFFRTTALLDANNFATEHFIELYEKVAALVSEMLHSNLLKGDIDETLKEKLNRKGHFDTEKLRALFKAKWYSRFDLRGGGSTSYLRNNCVGWTAQFLVHEYGINLECAMSMLLWTLSGVLIAKYRKTNTYSIYTVLFMIIVGSSAASKSPPMTKLLSFISRVYCL